MIARKLARCSVHRLGSTSPTSLSSAAASSSCRAPPLHDCASSLSRFHAAARRTGSTCCRQPLAWPRQACRHSRSYGSQSPAKNSAPTGPTVHRLSSSSFFTANSTTSSSFFTSNSSTSTARRMSSSMPRPAATKPKPKQSRMLASIAGTSAAAGAAGALLLAPFVQELDRIAPKFRIHGSQVQILETPTEFYDKLKSMIRKAEHRIFLSTLYIGKSETELIATLQEALRAKPGLKLYILTDALRGTREAPEPSCASLLAPLVAEFGPGRVELRMYHTPNLTGLRKKYVPKRINEGWGLQHMKLYGADDEILLSGANLSTDYFTNRQDRYHLFSSSALTDFYWQMHQSVASLSFLIQPEPKDPAGFTMVWPETNPAPSPLDEPHKFVDSATGVLQHLMEPLALASADASENAAGAASASPDTSVYVLAQLTQLLKPDCSTERPAITHVLETLAQPQYANSSWTFTAGYFNPAPSLTKLLLSTASTKNNTVITASPYANGFYQSRGVSGMLPDAYTFLAHKFLKTVTRQHVEGITLKEWRLGTVGQPGGWTYHAKGLWVTLGGTSPGTDPSASASSPPGPSLTLVGSSNYTKRSYSLDLEANALVVTTNPALQSRLAQEEQWLQRHAAPVTRDDFAQPERRVRLHVRIAMWIVQAVGGAL